MTQDLLITNFTNPVFQSMFKSYFSELGMKINDWDGLWEEMNTQNGGNFAYIRTQENSEVGFIQFTPITLENWFFKEKIGFIREFYITKEFRKQGHGSALLALTEKYFKDNGINKIVLTPDDNEQRFYLNRGYKEDNIEAKNQCVVFTKEI